MKITTCKPCRSFPSCLLLVSLKFLKLFAILLLISLPASALETFTIFILVVWSSESGSSVGNGGSVGSGGGKNALF